MKKLVKIDELLKTMGISEEARKEFIIVCEDWHKTEKATLQAEYKARLDKAKTVCMEEVEAHKASLSRGIKMFLENNSKSIRKASEKNAAIAESDAINTLNKVTKLLGGLNVDDAVNAQTLQAESKKNAELTNKVADLTESLNREKAKSAKFSELSEKTIARQRNMEVQLTESKKLLSEAHQSLTAKVKTTTILSERKIQAAKPQSTKKVVSESDKGKRTVSTVDNEIDLIAESIN
jgi:hypothetical protein